MSEFTIEEFERSSRENGVRFWDAQEFMERLGYESWTSFQGVIRKAMGSCARLNIEPSEVFIPHSYSDTAGKSTKTYKLTRFACFLISMHADAKKPEVVKVRAILAAIADQLIAERIKEQDLGRIEARDDLKLAERLMSGAAHEAGLESRYFGIFKNAGFLGMYNMGLRELMHHKGVHEDGVVLYDLMGLEELAGNLFRATQTAARIKKHGPAGLSQVSRTAQEVGSEVRQIMIKDGGIAPENLPLEEPISIVKSRLKTAARRMKKLDKPSRKRLPS